MQIQEQEQMFGNLCAGGVCARVGDTYSCAIAELRRPSSPAFRFVVTFRVFLDGKGSS